MDEQQRQHGSLTLPSIALPLRNFLLRKKNSGLSLENHYHLVAYLTYFMDSCACLRLRLNVFCEVKYGIFVEELVCW